MEIKQSDIIHASKLTVHEIALLFNISTNVAFSYFNDKRKLTKDQLKVIIENANNAVVWQYQNKIDDLYKSINYQYIINNKQSKHIYTNTKNFDLYWLNRLHTAIIKQHDNVIEIVNNDRLTKKKAIEYFKTKY